MRRSANTTGGSRRRFSTCDAAQIIPGANPLLSYSIESMLGGPYTYSGRPDRWVEVSRAQLAQRGATL